MKIKAQPLSYEQVLAKKPPKHRKPLGPSRLLNAVIRLISIPELLATRFRYTAEGMETVTNKPCLILMNHSSFIDLMIASRIFWPKRYGIVCTSDGFVGKSWLMRWLGCIPTQKFVSDISLIRDMEYLLKEKGVSVLMFPEAGYSLDGTATALPQKMGVLLKKLNVPVVTVITQGAFARQPLYNNLRKRKVPVSAHIKCLFTPEQLKEMTVAELDAKLDEVFTFDNFAWQQDEKVSITEPDRAEGLNRILYQCCVCGTEGHMEGVGTTLTCHHCGKVWELDELGQLQPKTGGTPFHHIPDWYAWQRQQVRKALEENTYRLDIPVDISMLVDTKALYLVGSGHLTHTAEGFTLTGCDGKLQYTQSPLASHSLNADYYWYEIADVISIGNKDALYYCFPKGDSDVVAKTRLAAEELYKLKKRRPTKPNQ